MKAGMKKHHAGSPMERVHIDILGPFIESASHNKYVLVMVDQYTKWVELAALPEQTAETVAHALVTQFLCRMGCAQEIFSDQGRNFESSLFHELCSLMEMAKLRTTPYRPSSNGQVERLNREILFKIRAYLDNKQRDWDRYLPFIGMALRSCVNESTGYSPNMMMLGREVDIPLDLLAGPAPANCEVQKSDSEYVHQLQTDLHEIHALARDQLQKSLQQRKQLYDRRQRKTSYDVGDLVYSINSASKKGQSRKLQSIYCGPFLVVAKISDILYQIAGKGGKNTQVIHHDRLRRCLDRDVPLWARRQRAEAHQIPTPNLDDSLDLDNLWKEDGEDSNFVEGEGASGNLEPGDSSSPLHDPGDDFSSTEHWISPENQGDPPSPGFTDSEMYPLSSRLRQQEGSRQSTRQSRMPRRYEDFIIY